MDLIMIIAPFFSFQAFADQGRDHVVSSRIFFAIV